MPDQAAFNTYRPMIHTDLQIQQTARNEEFVTDTATYNQLKNEMMNLGRRRNCQKVLMLETSDATDITLDVADRAKNL